MASSNRKKIVDEIVESKKSLKFLKEQINDIKESLEQLESIKNKLENKIRKKELELENIGQTVFYNPKQNKRDFTNGLLHINYIDNNTFSVKWPNYKRNIIVSHASPNRDSIMWSDEKVNRYPYIFGDRIVYTTLKKKDISNYNYHYKNLDEPEDKNKDDEDILPTETDSDELLWYNQEEKEFVDRLKSIITRDDVQTYKYHNTQLTDEECIAKQLEEYRCEFHSEHYNFNIFSLIMMFPIGAKIKKYRVEFLISSMNRYFEVLYADMEKIVIKKDSINLSENSSSNSVVYVSYFDKNTDTFLRFKRVEGRGSKFNVLGLLSNVDDKRGLPVDISSDYELMVSPYNDYFMVRQYTGNSYSNRDKIQVYNSINKYVTQISKHWSLNDDIVFKINRYLVFGNGHGNLFNIELDRYDKDFYFLFDKDNNILQLSETGCTIHNMEDKWTTQKLKSKAGYYEENARVSTGGALSEIAAMLASNKKMLSKIDNINNSDDSEDSDDSDIDSEDSEKSEESDIDSSDSGW